MFCSFDFPYLGFEGDSENVLKLHAFKRFVGVWSGVSKESNP